MKSIILALLICAPVFAGTDIESLQSEGVIVSFNEKKLKLKNSHGEYFYVDRAKALPGSKIAVGEKVIIKENWNDLMDEYKTNQEILKARSPAKK